MAIGLRSLSMRLGPYTPASRFSYEINNNKPVVHLLDVIEIIFTFRFKYNIIYLSKRAFKVSDYIIFLF